MKPDCQDIEPLLVDYADGELSSHEVTHVEDHLADCIGCQSTLAALHRSMEAAQTIWQDGSENSQGSISDKPIKHRLPRMFALAAALLLTFGME